MPKPSNSNLASTNPHTSQVNYYIESFIQSAWFIQHYTLSVKQTAYNFIDIWMSFYVFQANNKLINYSHDHSKNNFFPWRDFRQTSSKGLLKCLIKSSMDFLTLPFPLDNILG